MNKHRFKPLKFSTASSIHTTDWCCYADVPFTQLAQMTEDEANGHVCHQPYDEPVHWVTDDLSALYDQLYELESKSYCSQEDQKRVDELNDAIAKLEGRK